MLFLINFHYSFGKKPILPTLCDNQKILSKISGSEEFHFSELLDSLCEMRFDPCKLRLNLKCSVRSDNFV